MKSVIYDVSFFSLSGVILRPGFIYGTRRVGSMKLPLGVIGTPMEMVSSVLIHYLICLLDILSVEFDLLLDRLNFSNLQ